MPVALDRAIVHVWFRVTGAIEEAAAAPAVSLLSQEERARHDRLIFPRDRRDFAEAHALTRRVLSLYEDVPPAGWRFETAPGGKPFLPRAAGTAPLHFNLSHTRGLVACAVTRDGDVGLDVESIDRPVDERGISRRYFTPAEDTFLHACRDDERATRFIELWTLKEAYIKAIGQGLAHPLNEFGFAFEGTGGVRFDAPSGTDATEWTFALFAPVPSARMAVAVRSPASCAIVARADGSAEALLPLRASVRR